MAELTKALAVAAVPVPLALTRSQQPAVQVVQAQPIP